MLNQIAELSMEEKILLVERIWDDIAANSQTKNWRISDDLKAELNRRYLLVKEGKSQLYSWEQAQELIIAENPSF